MSNHKRRVRAARKTKAKKTVEQPRPEWRVTNTAAEPESPTATPDFKAGKDL